MASSKPEETTTPKAPMSHPKGNHSETNDLAHHTKKPCRSCVDFKTWVKQTNKSQAGAKAEVSYKDGVYQILSIWEIHELMETFCCKVDDNLSVQLGSKSLLHSSD